MTTTRFRSMIRKAILPLSLLLVVTLPLAATGEDQDRFDPVGLFLTWQQDPTTTMTIDFHTVPEQGERDSIVQYRGPDEEEWSSVTGDSHPFPHSERTIHRVELTGLEPGSTYRFRFGEDSQSYRFRTMPSDIIQEPVRFMNGGDTLAREQFRRMNRVAVQYDPDFIVWGGDLAYANGDPTRVHLWYDWFDGIKETLIDEDGRVIPILVTIGNHELFGERRLTRRGRMTQEEAEAWMEQYDVWDGKVTYFFDLFAFPGEPAYGVLDFSDYLSVILLDSDHDFSVRGEQTEWLERTLAERDGRPHIFPVYHVPAYPSARAYTGGTSTRIRENWSPLFERYGVRVALEAHDHTYKRTHPMLADEVHPGGIVYLGDGAWGDVGIRDRRESEHQDRYLARFEAIRHGIVVTLHGPHQHFLMVDVDGEIIDEYPQTPRPR